MKDCASLVSSAGYRHQHQAGASLIETVITIVILGIALTAVSNGLFLRLQHSSDYLWQVRALQLGQSYLDDALSLAYQEESPAGGGSIGSCSIAGPESGENQRRQFDDVDDYNGLSESGRFLDNSVRTNYSLYQVSIDVRCANASGQTSLSSKLVQIEIVGPAGLRLRLAAVRGDF